MKTTSLAAARRYARALLDVALQAGVAEALRADLRGAMALLAEHEELATAVTHPGLPLEARKRAALGVWAGDGTSEIFRRLVGLLIENGRLGLLPAIEESFTAQWNAHRRVASAQVVSAVTLEADETRAVVKALEVATGMRIEVHEEIEPAVLGGVLVRVGGLSYDGTVRARLHALKDRLATGA